MRSNTSSMTWCGRASGRSILFTTTIGLRPSSKALRRTNRVCGIVPSAASTTRRTASTILRTRSTSPPKSLCPGVSTMFTFVPWYRIDVFFARIVIPRSFSRSLLSMIRSVPETASFARKVPDCFRRQSTSVVLP